MNTDRSQRWRERRDSYRPAGEVFDPSKFGVELIPGDSEARAFIERHHYSGSYPNAVHRMGLYHRRSSFFAPELCGVAVFGVGSNEATVPKYAPGLHAREGLELSRLCLRDETGDGTIIAGNAETWMLARAFNLLMQAERAKRRDNPERRPLRMVLAYSDPVPRRNVDGHLVMPGHIGQIYQAFSGRFVGRASKRVEWLARDGTIISERALSKIRADEDPVRGVGHRYSYQQLLRVGCPTRKPGESGVDYVARVKASGFLTPVKHPGNLVYVWPMTNTGKNALLPPMPFPTLSEYGLPVNP
jgi:hypothetical protein